MRADAEMTMISNLCILSIHIIIFDFGLTAQHGVDDAKRKVQYKVFDQNYHLVDEADLKIPDNKSLIVFAHGFRCSTKSRTIMASGKLLARSTDSNVVLVDWSDWTTEFDYGSLVVQLPTVVSHLVDWLNSARDRGTVKTFGDVTLIGHSLGAHLVGIAGRRLNGTVGTVVALDPAQPNFKMKHKNERVDVSSGQFVMVLHTSTLFFGLREPLGHVDFYFNGGQYQPTCMTDIVCGHIMAIIYMMDSLKNATAYPASRCCTVDDCEQKIVDLNEPTIYMNINTPVSTRGMYSITPGRKNLKFDSHLLGFNLSSLW